MHAPASAVVLIATSLATSSLWCTSLLGRDSHTAPASSEHATGPAPHGLASAVAAGSGHVAGGPSKFPVPFAWEVTSSDPIAKTRGFMTDIAADNAAFVKSHPSSYFKPFLDAQHPRATVITCADSRVQSPAFHDKPDDDLFFVRNIGNQIATAQGSVEYGVHHLKTPVLMILGHTGCGAVRAAMGDYSKESEAVRRELDPLHVREDLRKPGDAKAWAEAVVDNVHAQVAAAVRLFAHEMEGGDLTVVGAVYDFRNDLKQGYGKLVVVNVNGQTNPERVNGFVRAIGSSVAPSASSSAPIDGVRASPHVFVSR